MSDVKEKIKQYISLRDYKAQAKKDFEKGLERVNKAMQKLESELLTVMTDQGTDSLPTKMGTAYQITRTSATVQDRDVFFRHAVNTKNLDLIDIKANKKAVRKAVKAGEQVPGVKYTEAIQVGVRRGSDYE